MTEIKEEELKPGYNYDPYMGEETAPFFLGVLIGKITGNPDGFISTTREWHILWEGIMDGAYAKTMDDFPKCPPLWYDEKLYYEVPGKIVNMVKCQWPTVLFILSLMGVKVAVGV